MRRPSYFKIAWKEEDAGKEKTLALKVDMVSA